MTKSPSLNGTLLCGTPITTIIMITDCKAGISYPTLQYWILKSHVVQIFGISKLTGFQSNLVVEFSTLPSGVM